MCFRNSLLGAVFSLGIGLHARAAVIEIGGGRQLFLDDHIVDAAKTRGVVRTMNAPQDIQRVMRPDQPWEALGFIFYCSVVDVDGKAMLYYGSYDAEKKKHLCLATSTDGLHWERSKLGLKAFGGNKDNNLLGIEAVEASVFIDPHAPAEKRFRLPLTRYWPDPDKAGMYVASAPDGIHWSLGAERLLPFIPDNQPSAFWDERSRQYAVYMRAWDPVRAVARVAVDELEKPWPYDKSVTPFLAWGKGKIATLSRELPRVMARDDQDPENLELYTSAIAPYPFAPDVYLAFPAAYLLFKGPDWKAQAVNTNDGTFDVQFATSRDGIAWKRWREPYVSGGMRDGLNLRLVSMGPGFVRRGFWLYQYFVGWPYTHGQPVVWDKVPASRAEWMKKDLGGIYCSRQRVDGFVSMDAANASGTLTTLPLSFKGNRLRLNVHTAGIGSVRVALLKEDGTVLPGYSAEDCELICADALDQEVRWKGGPDISAIAGQPVRVQLTMRNAKLYALQFVAAQ